MTGKSAVVVIVEGHSDMASLRTVFGSNSFGRLAFFHAGWYYIDNRRGATDRWLVSLTYLVKNNRLSWGTGGGYFFDFFRVFELTAIMRFWRDL